MKTTREYQSLPKAVQRVVTYLALRRESPDRGAFESQQKIAERVGVSRQTLNEYLRAAVDAGVLLVEKTYRERGTKGGRSTNRYRLNEALLSSPRPTQPATQPRTQPATAEPVSPVVEPTDVEPSPTGSEIEREEPSRIDAAPAPVDPGPDLVLARGFEPFARTDLPAAQTHEEPVTSGSEDSNVPARQEPPLLRPLNDRSRCPDCGGLTVVNTDDDPACTCLRELAFAP
jgi:transcriptional regulator with XRE-family HTH domain